MAPFSTKLGPSGIRSIWSEVQKHLTEPCAWYKVPYMSASVLFEPWHVISNKVAFRQV